MAATGSENTTYGPKCYRDDNGNRYNVGASGVFQVHSGGAIDLASGAQQTLNDSAELEVESGGLVQVESGGTVEFESGGILDFQAGALLKDTTKGVTAERIIFCDKKALTGTASTAGGIGNWQAPTGSNIVIVGCQYHMTAASATAGCVLDIGTTSASATTKSDTLMDGVVATGSVTGVKNDQKHAGTNGVGAQALTAGKWITVSATSSKATSLAGNLYVQYFVV